MVLLDVGLVLLAAGLLRARAVPRWAPWLTIVTVAADFAIQFTSVTATWPVTVVWGALVVSFGSIGLRLLSIPPAEWAAASQAPSREAGPTGSVPSPVSALTGSPAPPSDPDLQAFIGSVGATPAPPEITIAEAVSSPDQY